jgi:beta-phosphoglucomutase family hydrolase
LRQEGQPVRAIDIEESLADLLGAAGGGLNRRRSSPEACGLPRYIDACLFDLDGVLTDTARIHRRCWAAMFDTFLRERADVNGEPFVPFNPIADYDSYIDGKLRYDGVRAFLAARGIELPEGEPNDPPEADTVCALGNRKERAVVATLRREGVGAFPGSVRYLQAARDAGLQRAVVSASSNCRAILRRAQLAGLLEQVVDGRVARTEGLRGKPAPDTYLEAAHRLRVAPEHAAVFEDAIAGVEAGRAGDFGLVVGVDRAHAGPTLLAHGATIVVSDLADLLQGTAR